MSKVKKCENYLAIRSFTAKLMGMNNTNTNHRDSFNFVELARKATVTGSRSRSAVKGRALRAKQRYFSTYTRIGDSFSCAKRVTGVR